MWQLPNGSSGIVLMCVQTHTHKQTHNKQRVIQTKYETLLQQGEEYAGILCI